MFNTHVLVACMLNRLSDDCVGVSEYGPEVVEYCEEVGEYDCDVIGCVDDDRVS